MEGIANQVGGDDTVPYCAAGLIDCLVPLGSGLQL
jgi:hypothetical protein